MEPKVFCPDAGNSPADIKAQKKADQEEADRIAASMRPFTHDVNRPAVHSSNPRRAVGSPADIDQQISKLQADKAESERQEKEQQANEEQYQKDRDKACAAALASLMKETVDMVKRCPGERTLIPCPVCSTPSTHAGALVKRLILTYPGSDIKREETVSLGAPIFLMRAQKDRDVVLCPRCGYEALVF